MSQKLRVDVPIEIELEEALEPLRQEIRVLTAMVQQILALINKTP